MERKSELKSIALVGRPNVGKSRLFNRLLGRRVSIVHDQPGVTRDIVLEKISDNALLMDTGGMGATAEMTEKIIADATNEQANFAIVAADVIVFVVDSQAGLTALDEEIASLLRSSGKKVVLAVNKVDLPMHEERAAEFHRLGFRDVVEISAEHGYGMDALAGVLERECGDISTPPSDDTAGLRVKRKTNTSLDYLSSLRTRRAIEASDVAILVLDAMEGVSELDKRLAGEIVACGASLIVVVNKWDYATETFAKSPLRGYTDIRQFGEKFDEAVRQKLGAIGDSPIYFVSAKDNKGVDRLLEAAWRMYKKMNSTVPTSKLNSCVKKLVDTNPPKYVDGKRFKVYYCVKTASRPYTIRMYCNRADSLTETYRRYLVNGIRDSLNLGGVSVKIETVGKTPQTLQERLGGK